MTEYKYCSDSALLLDIQYHFCDFSKLVKRSTNKSVRQLSARQLREIPVIRDTNGLIEKILKKCDINYHIHYELLLLNINTPTFHAFIKSKEKPQKYDILLHDLFNDEYWSFNKHITLLNYSPNINIYNYITEWVNDFVNEKNEYLKQLLVDNKYFLLKKLNQVDTEFFHKIFIDYYKLITQNQIIKEKKYYDIFINILSEKPNNSKLGNYILSKYENWFDDMLNDYCSTNLMHEEINTDAYYVVNTIFYTSKI